ncbi:MAG: MotA/TolQ/ExbB proton channel family protein [Planctomycetota bacterium]|nr:MotA/TolQ/ExbB proton channel family protein [Planctomycetota bacterium]
MLMIVYSILAQTQGPDDAVDTSAVAVQSIWDFIAKGGMIMIPIGIGSFIALAVFLERMLSLRRSKVIPAKFLPGLKKILKESKGEKKAAVKYCLKDGSPVANVFAAGMKKLNAPIEILEKHIQESGQREVLKLRKNVRALSVIASISPLMGLLGTIFGMIKAFQTVAISPDALGKTELLATGIYQAMITTAAGLTVAIPVLIAYHVVSAKIDRLVMEIDLMTVEFIEEFAEGGIESVESDELASDSKQKSKTAATKKNDTPRDDASGAKVATT